MLDLARFFGTSVSVISFMFVCFVAGSAIGSLTCKLTLILIWGLALFIFGMLGNVRRNFTVGHLLDKFPSQRYWLLLATVALYGAPVALVTSTRSLALFLALWLVSGAGSGGMVTGCNVLCLDTWRDSGQGGA